MESFEIINNLKLLTLNITENCNAKCIYCDWWKQKKNSSPLKELIFSIDDAIKIGLKGVRISGGEPLLYPNLQELISYIKKRNLIAMICTSANTNFQEMMTIVEAGTDVISISIDTLEPHIFKKIRGYPIDVVLKNIRSLSKIRLKGFEIILSVVLTPMNLNGLTDLLEYSKKLDLVVNITPCQYNSHVNQRIRNNLEFKENDRVKLKNLMTKIKNSSKNGLRLLNSDKFLTKAVDFLIDGAIPLNHECMTGFSSAIRMVNGKIKLCHSLEPLPKDPISKIWFSTEATALRQKMVRLECSFCWVSCHVDQRRFLNPKYISQEIWDIL